MTKEQDQKLVENGNGGNLFLSPDIVNDTACPMSPGAMVTSILIPDVGVLIVPKSSRPSFPIEYPE